MAQGSSTNKQKLTVVIPSADVTMQNAATATGNGTSLTVTGYATALVQVTGTFSASITLEGTMDGSNYDTISFNKIGSSQLNSSITSTGIYAFPVAGLTSIRARISSYASGSVTVLGRAIATPLGPKDRYLASSTDTVRAHLYGFDGSGNVLVGASLNGDLTIAGAAEHDSANDDADYPVKTGGVARSALSSITLVANGDITHFHSGLDGVQIVRTHANLEDIVQGNASNTDGTSTQVIAAAGSGIKQYLTSCTITNTSSTNTYCEIKSGTTVRWTFPVPANGGVTHTWDVPLPPNAANEAWNFDMGAAVTTAYCSLSGFKSKV